ncbi:response regulator [Mangrovibrevibacter kandeliae]|uniref:response regulator n=1 Tax=Mangrovibrevibacter kandeliae TaxID=2968473 RepID=UPI0021194D88|nr:MULTISPECIES: response regulator [unclassified Aurantimonas]MCQ8783936.1 response regulator [Aurantimonas sp. CSK15Z-1]MCW4116654.1 response regulator [Aurantimonas sp. MSK8Z-1]
MQQLAAVTETSALEGLRVLVVEDESLVAMQLEDMLLDLGCAVVGPAMRLSRALEMAAEAGIDIAILDVNLGGERVYPVAQMIRDRKIPIVFATGYGRAGVDAVWHDCPILQKPYTENQLAEMMGLAMTPRTPA